MSRRYKVFDADRWGIPLKAVKKLTKRLRCFWENYAQSFQTKTRNTSEYAYRYLSGLLRMETKRNFANIGRKTEVAEQNMHHFMSNSPWSGQAVMIQIQEDIASIPLLKEGGVVILDESADQKYGEKSTGASRQYNGRLGKVEMSQVGVFLGYVNLKATPVPVWTWIDGALFLPESWFSSEMVQERERLGITPELTFKTKIELGWEMTLNLKHRKFHFEALACDTLYGRSVWFRSKLREEKIIYMADVPINTMVYLEHPRIGIPQRQGNHGRYPTRERILTPSVPVELVACLSDTQWSRVYVRPTERGELNDNFAFRRVWTTNGDEYVEEWLVIREWSNGERSYSLSNAPLDTPFEQLAWLKCQRYFVEQSNREAKSEIGWDELEAQKYRAWEHHLAFTVLASWFIAKTKMDWTIEYHRDPDLAEEFDTKSLPNLSIANVRDLLRSVMPLPQLSPEQAISLVIKHLVNRTISRNSRMRNRRHYRIILT